MKIFPNDVPLHRMQFDPRRKFCSLVCVADWLAEGMKVLAADSDGEKLFSRKYIMGLTTFTYGIDHVYLRNIKAKQDHN